MCPVVQGHRAGEDSPRLGGQGLLSKDYTTGGLTDEEYETWEKLIAVLSGDPRAVADHLVDNFILHCIEGECDTECDFAKIVEKYFLPGIPEDLRIIVIKHIDEDTWGSVEKEFVEVCEERLDALVNDLSYILDELGLLHPK